jgi:RNAse (barnase) inhibitor barstar
MKKFSSLILLLNFYCCSTNTGNSDRKDSFRRIIVDTTNNYRAKWDLSSISHFSEIAKQLSFTDITKGADSLEIRAWYDFSFSNSEELYTIKLIDTTCILSYYRIYTHSYDYENNNHVNWNPFTQPIIDSALSKTVSLKEGDYKSLNIDSIWNLKSQSEIKMPDTIGFTDCDSYSIEIADKRVYKFVSYHCPNGYYEKLKKKEILDFLNCFGKIMLLVEKSNVRIPYKYD